MSGFLWGDGSGPAGTGTSLSLTWPTVQAGDVVVLALGLGGISTITDPSGGWTAIDNLDQSTTLRTKAWSKVCSGSETGTQSVTWADALTSAGGWAFYRGISTTTPVGNHNVTGSTASSTSRATTSLASMNNTVREINIVIDTNTTGVESWTAPGGFTERVDISGTLSPYIGLTIQDKDTLAGLPMGSSTSTSARTGTAFVAYHFALNQATPTTFTAANVTGTFANQAPAPPIAQTGAAFIPRPSTGQIWPRGA